MELEPGGTAQPLSCAAGQERRHRGGRVGGQRGEGEAEGGPFHGPARSSSLPVDGPTLTGIKRDDHVFKINKNTEHIPPELMLGIGF